jgi:hypothetical protein
MWSVLFGGTLPWVAAIATLLLVLAATLLIIHQVRASDGDMSVRLRWLGLHVQRSSPSRTPQTPPADPVPTPAADDPYPDHRTAAPTASVNTPIKS